VTVEASEEVVVGGKKSRRLNSNISSDTLGKTCGQGNGAGTHVWWMKMASLPPGPSWIRGQALE